MVKIMFKFFCHILIAFRASYKVLLSYPTKSLKVVFYEENPFT